MGRGTMQLNRAVEDSEDEEAEFSDEEEDAQKSRRTSKEGVHIQEDLAKAHPYQKKKLQSLNGKAPPPNQKTVTGNGKDAQRRQSSDKKNEVKTKSNQGRSNASSSRSQVSQSANKAFANITKVSELTFAQSNVVANQQKGQKTANNVAQKPKQSFAATAKPQPTSSKRKPMEDLGIAESKKSKQDLAFAKLLDEIYNQDNLDSDDEEETEPMTIDRLIKKAEKASDVATGAIGKNDPVDETDKSEMLNVAAYASIVARLQKKSSEAGKEPCSQSPIWSTDQSSFQKLHAMQTMNIIVCDILASYEGYAKGGKDPIMKLLSIYLCKFQMCIGSKIANTYLLAFLQ
jgi:hypothetical protein